MNAEARKVKKEMEAKATLQIESEKSILSQKSIEEKNNIKLLQ